MVVSDWVRSHPGLVSSIVIGGACAGSLYYNYRTIMQYFYTRRIMKSILAIKRQIYVVTSGAAWNNVEPLLLKEAKREGAVGFDCEWVQVEGKRRPVAMIQLASCSGVCVLIRLSHMKSGIPTSLKAILENRSILKVGVGPLEDSSYLSTDYNITVQGCIDLRHLVHRCLELPSDDSHGEERDKSAGGMGLNSLAVRYLGRTLDKDWRVRSSDWEADTLTERQKKYAAEDALVGIHILMKLVEKLWTPSTAVPFLPSPMWSQALCTAILHTCNGLLDVKFSQKKDHDSVTRNNQNPNLKLKSSAMTTSIRKEPLYHQCQLLAPDNMTLCKVEPKKAHWYINKGLGKLVNEDPLIVRLNFEPAGRPLMNTQEGRFQLQERKNMCVVCGKDDSYIRKNVIPHEYRKYFPKILKVHESHDIVLLCVKCHKQSDVYDNMVRNQLAKECDAPLRDKKCAKYTIDKSLKGVKCAASALLKRRSAIPEEKVRELEDIVKKYYGVQCITQEHLDNASKICARILNEDYKEHNKVVYEFYKKIGLVKLEKKWREHFLRVRNPQHMPHCWSVNHSAIKVHRKMSSLPLKHPDREIFKIALVGTDGTIDVPYNPQLSREYSPIEVSDDTS